MRVLLRELFEGSSGNYCGVIVFEIIKIILAKGYKKII